jgi:hypothetical protein
MYVILPARRYDVVFWLEPLPWRDTRARRERSEEDATRVSSFLKNCYGHWGYGLLTVPKMTIAQRCDYILERLHLTQEQLHDANTMRASTATHCSRKAKQPTRRRSG